MSPVPRVVSPPLPPPPRRQVTAAAAARAPGPVTRRALEPVPPS